MIYKLRKKLLLISAVSVAAVFLIIYAVIWAVGGSVLNKAMDTLTDSISASDSRFYTPDHGDNRFFGFVNEETRYSTRFFTVKFDYSGTVSEINTDSVSVVTVATACEYAQKAVDKHSNRGWIDNYRYSIVNTGSGYTAVFVDGNTNRSLFSMVLIATGIVLLLSGAIIIVLITVFSGRAVKPIAESYQKQKQFITDANHELKTPLTLILTNLDIAQSELGENEWLEDIRTEGLHMTALVNELVALSRMDENRTAAQLSEFNLSSAVNDTVSEFCSAAAERNKTVSSNIAPDIMYSGDEAAIRRLLSVLADNAVKYCDEGGEISFSLENKRYPVLRVENTFADVENTELERLFDRFYRSDKARTHNGSFGIGLSIARSVAENHNGSITAYKKDGNRIGFEVVLKNVSPQKTKKKPPFKRH